MPDEFALVGGRPEELRPGRVAQQPPSCHALPRLPLSGNRSFDGRGRTVRKPWIADGEPDKMIAGQGSGQEGAVARIGYARVSTTDQDLALQRDALAVAGCERVFEDRASSAKADRPGLAQALAYARNGDVLVVWKLDRLGRSLSHLIDTVRELDSRDVGLRSLTEQIDTTTPGGRLIFHLFGALGQFERDLIRERTRAGLKAAEARGRRGGRKPVVTAEKLRRAREHIARGLSVREAAARVRVGKTALYAALTADTGGSAPIAGPAP